MLRRSATPAISILLTIAVAACGFGAGRGTSDVTVTVTRDFGSRVLGQVRYRHIPGSETVMRLLERSFTISTRYGGGFVESIDGRSGTADRRDWFYYVNGVEASKGAAATTVHRGDEIWWDLHDWSGAEDTPAVVGSFPEPFIHGVGGRRLPVTLECAADARAACTQVTNELDRLHVPVASQLLGTGSGSDSLTLEVGAWRELRGQVVAALLDSGPRASGVYARFRAGGRQLELLDPHGRVARTLAAGAGLVAATAQGAAGPTWLITGTDAAGVAAAAAALTPASLHDHFALAVSGGALLPLPLRPSL
jgi:hypothetical protein